MHRFAIRPNQLSSVEKFGLIQYHRTIQEQFNVMSYGNGFFEDLKKGRCRQWKAFELKTVLCLDIFRLLTRIKTHILKGETSLITTWLTRTQWVSSLIEFLAITSTDKDSCSYYRSCVFNILFSLVKAHRFPLGEFNYQSKFNGQKSSI